MIRIPASFAASVLAGVLAVAPAVAQTPDTSTQPPVTDGYEPDTVTVTGTVVPERMRDYVQQLMEPGKLGVLSRWDDKICPGVVGLKPNASQLMLDRIAARAMSVGLKVGDPGCKANILIVVTEDAQKFTPTFVQQNKKLFGDSIDGGNTLGKNALATFSTTPKPVRWWHVAQTVTDRGQVLGDSNATPSNGEGFSGAQVARVNNASRVKGATHQEFNRIVAIVDTSKTKGVPFDAITDYIALIALAQVQADVNAAGYNSILNVFDDPMGDTGPLKGWTEWDTAFVSGLYAVRTDYASSTQQENDIVRHVKEANAEEERKAAEADQKS